MDLASGYSDAFNYGNGYTPLANNAINNNNLAYNANQNYANQVGQYDPFAQSGGFGALTDYYSSLGAAYGRNTGGFNAMPATPSGDVQRGPDLPNISPTPDPFGGMSSADMATWQRAMQAAGRGAEIPGGSSSFADRFDAAPAIDYRLQPTPAQQLPGGIYDGVFAPTTPRSVTIGDDFQSRFGDWGGSNIPIMNRGGDPQPQPQPQISGGAGTSWGGASMGPLAGMSAADTATWIRAMTAAGRASEIPSGTQTPAPFGGPDTNLYGYPGSGNLADTRSGAGGIGSDTARDRMAWTLAQQGPAITPTPSNGPYPNLGYNPGMSNYFANPAMQQYDWTANNANMIKQMQDALGTIDRATGNTPAPPYGGELPSFWQGVRDWTGMGPARAEPWVNGS
jgi:hypothetical protein